MLQQKLYLVSKVWGDGMIRRAAVQAQEGAVAPQDVQAAASTRTQSVDAKRVYHVQTGDSLAYTALQFCGSPTASKRIFEASRSTLQSPERIQIGQRLTIPS